MAVRLDDLRLFAALPTAHLVLDTDLVVLQANPAYLHLMGICAAALIGHCFFDALPPRAPTMTDDVSRLHQSFERVLATARPDTIPAECSWVVDPDTGHRCRRWWSSVTVPVLDDDGHPEFLVQRVEDITDYVLDHEDRRRHGGARSARASTTRFAETELFARARETQASREAERSRARHEAALAAAAVEVAAARDVDELTDVLVHRALDALGAHGGAVAVRDGDVVRMYPSESLDAAVGPEDRTTPVHSPRPSAVSTRTGRRILLRDRAAAVAHADGMDEILTRTGCEAWAALPLIPPAADGTAAGVPGDGAALGSLLIGWTYPQTFTASVVDVLDAFAAQCARALARVHVHQEEQDQAEATFQLARALQRSMLSEPAHPDGLDVVTRYRPATRGAQVGGDWYDSFVTSAGFTTLVVGDVCGHDREAAAAMGQARNLLRGIAYTVHETPAQVLGLLDRALLGLEVEALITAVVVSVEQDARLAALDRHRLRWSNAGHPPPLLIRPDGGTALLRDDAELLLGLDPGTTRRDHSVEVAAGSTLLLYTDGLVERRGGDLDRGLDWLTRSAARLAHVGLDALCDSLLQQVQEDTEDDTVLLALRV